MVMILFYCLVPIGVLLFGFLAYTIVPTYYNKLFSQEVIRKTSQEKEILLSFDDGPDKRYTEKILNVLKEENVSATFFVVAENAEKNPELITRMQQENHTIALHSAQHKNAMWYGYSYTKYDFEKSLAVMKKLGISVEFYRPPWGHSNLFTTYFVQKYHLKMILWNIMAQDWKEGVTPELIGAKLMTRTKKYPIICLHDAGETTGGAKDAPLQTIEALKQVIPMLKEKGYEFIPPERILYESKDFRNTNKAQETLA